jgi:hypothetical protein
VFVYCGSLGVVKVKSTKFSVTELNSVVVHVNLIVGAVKTTVINIRLMI